MVAETLREDYGRFLDVRDVRRVRRVSGAAWTVSVVLAAASGDLHVADLTVDDAAPKIPRILPDTVLQAIREERRAPAEPQIPDELANFGAEIAAEFGTGADSETGLELFDEMAEPIETRIEAAIRRGDRASLEEARELLPRMLGDHDKRGVTLLTMAEVEVKLGETKIALGYLEAAAREFADHFDLDRLEKAAALELGLVGHERFATAPVHTLLERNRARLTPIDNLFASRSFSHLSEHLQKKLAEHVTLRTLAPEEMLVQEGEPSKNLFVVKSGLLGVWLEKPSGGSWLVRCCFPGWLLGESSVLANNARCTASLRAERVSQVWVIDQAIVREIMAEDAELATRIKETKQIHRIDSFFSMHETMGELDVQVRDEILSCIRRVETFDEVTLLMPANEIPKEAFLVARGAIELYDAGNDDKLIGVVEADSFYGVRDAMHRIAPSAVAIARPGTTVAFFDGVRLQKLGAESPEHVTAVLERLG